MARRWLSILEGDDPRSARPIVATEDPDIIRSVASELARRLQDEPGPSCGTAEQPPASGQARRGAGGHAEA